MDLVTFLRARLDEDEADVRESRALNPNELHWSMPDWLHRDRLMAEVAAKRAILAEHATLNNTTGAHDSEYCAACHGDRGYNPQGFPMPCQTVRLLALPYATHPDYDEAWRPAA